MRPREGPRGQDITTPIREHGHDKHQRAARAGSGRGADDERRARRRRREVVLSGRGLGSPVRHGEPAHHRRVRAARSGRGEVGSVRLLPAHEGRVLDGGRLWRGRRGPAPGRPPPAGGGRRLHQPEHPDLADRGLRGGRRRCRDHRRDLPRRPEQSGTGDPGQGRPGDRRDQRHLLARAVGQVARLVRRDGVRRPASTSPRRIPPAPIRSRSPGSRARPAPAGSRPAIRASRKRSRTARSRSSIPSTAIPARRFSSSWSRTRSRLIRTSTTSSAPR